MTFRSTRLAIVAGGVMIFGSGAAAQVPGIHAYLTNTAPGHETPYRPNLQRPAFDVVEGSGRSIVRARAALDAGKYARAKGLLERSLRTSSDPEARYLSAVAASGLRETEAAHQLFAEALALDADHIGARVGLALIDIQLRRSEAAAASLALIEARRAACQARCRDASALDRAARIISHFLNASDTSPAGPRIRQAM